MGLLAVLLLMGLIFGSENKAEDTVVVVKIEEDEYLKVKSANSSNYIGVFYDKRSSRWIAQRWSKKQKKVVSNGTYKDETKAAQASDTLAKKLMGDGEERHYLNFSHDDTEVHPEIKMTSSKFIGVCYDKRRSNWIVRRCSKKQKKEVRNGSYNDETKAAQASDTLARNLMRNGEKGYKLNFPDDDTEVYAEVKVASSNYSGVYYDNANIRWVAQRWSKKQKKECFNGSYKDETKTAQASDTLARKLMRDGEKGYKINFPDDDTEVHPEVKVTTSKYIGVYRYYKNVLQYNSGLKAMWRAQRWNKKQKKEVHNGYYRYEREAARASDTLARVFMRDGEEGYKLNFTDEEYHRTRVSGWETNHEIDEKEGIYSKRKRYSSGNSGIQQEYLVYKME